MTFEMTITKKSTVDGVPEERTVRIKSGQPLSDRLLVSMVHGIIEGDVEVEVQGERQGTSIRKPEVGDISAPPTATATEDHLKERQIHQEAKVTPLIGSKDTGFTIGDRVKKTYVKGDFAPVYVECNECGYKGGHDTNVGNLYTKCRGCGEKLFLRNATDITGEEDADGWVFIAQDRYLTRKERWEIEEAEKKMVTRTEEEVPV